MSFKSAFICNICNLVLKDPITLPCLCVICGQHLHDGSSKYGMIKCLKCGEVFDIPKEGFEANTFMATNLDEELYLTEEEKCIKHAIQNLIQKLEQLKEELMRKHSNLERISFDHFSEVRRQIDIHREELKAKVDEISLKMVEQVNENEAYFISKTENSSLLEVNITLSMQTLANEFRRPDLVIENVKLLRNEHELMLDEFQVRLNELGMLKRDIKSLGFNATSDFQDASFGNLVKFNGLLLAYALGQDIRIWDMKSNELVASIDGHLDEINCLKLIDENRFVSGSKDTTIKIWNAKDFTCLKTLTQINNKGVWSIAILDSNRLASGSEGEINIWDIESGRCIQKLTDYSGWIFDLIRLPRGLLVSCSHDNAIVVWDLEKGTCLKKLIGHLSGINCLLVLNDGHLASGSQDKTIKIWNVASGECVKTLDGHTSSVSQLQAQESGQLISCSYDSTIKVWDLTDGSCLKTIVQHTDEVRSIRINSHGKHLVSCSTKETIKTWNLKTDECINVITEQRGAKIFDFIFI